MEHTIIITEQQANKLQGMLNDPQANNVGQSFSVDTLKATDWNNAQEIIDYCEKCRMLCLGEGASRKVYQIDDEKVLKIDKEGNRTTETSQNQNEIDSYQKCKGKFKNFVPLIYDFDREHKTPFWIISEQVLPASYADFNKLLGINFGSFESPEDIEELNKDLDTYSKYDGKKAGRYAVNLMDFLEAYDEGDVSIYQNEFKNNKWLRGLYDFLQYGLVNSWELEIINNWGLVKRNGKPQLVILDIGI